MVAPHLCKFTGKLAFQSHVIGTSDLDDIPCLFDWEIHEVPIQGIIMGLFSRRIIYAKLQVEYVFRQRRHPDMFHMHI